MINSVHREENLLLLKVIEAVLGEELDVICYVFTQTSDGFFHTIQAEVRNFFPIIHTLIYSLGFDTSFIHCLAKCKDLVYIFVILSHSLAIYHVLIDLPRLCFFSFIFEYRQKSSH